MQLILIVVSKVSSSEMYYNALKRMGTSEMATLLKAAKY